MIKRKLTEAIRKRLNGKKALIVYGARQTGKTTLIKYILPEISDNVLYLNGDDSDVRELFSSYSSTQLRAVIGKNDTVFIDEAQRVKEIGVIIKIIVDNFPETKVIATGSSSFELLSNISEPLTGRKYEFLLYPLSFGEMAEHHGLLDESRLLEQRLLYGYYPEIVTSIGEERELLKLLADSYLYKDLLKLESIAKPALLEKIVKALALQVGSEVSFNEISQLVGANNATVEKYITLLEQAFVIFQLPAFSRNVRNEIKKGKKIYFYDNGIRNAVINNFTPIESRADKGALWENFLICERMKRNAYNGISAKTYFWRTTQHQEIDYIEEIDGALYAYEFKYSETAKARLPLTFSKAYPDSSFRLIGRQNYKDFLIQD
jgi:predicted AAA+ superfamily ATPase